MIIPAEVEQLGRAWLREERSVAQAQGYNATLRCIRGRIKAEKAFSAICSKYGLRYILVGAELGDMALREYLAKEQRQ